MTLFSSFRLGPYELRNRIVMAPMTRSRALGNVPNDLVRDYYAQRATAGLIITEGTSPSPNGLGYARIPGLFSPEQVAGWKPVTEAVHARGGRIFAQLMHTGRIGHEANLPAGGRILAPSAVRADGQMWTDSAMMQPHPTPVAMTSGDIETARGEFVSAAKNAVAAGFDGIELHSANGYLLEQFLHPHSNRRTDEYGGSVEKRARFVVETARAASEAIGRERVGIRLSPYNTFNDLPLHDEVHAQYLHLARELRGLAYLHIVGSAHAGFGATRDAMREAFGGPVIANGNFDRARAEAAIAAGHGDLTSFGRPFIANPDLVARLEKGLELAQPDGSTFYTPDAKGYTDYPTAT